MWSGHGGYTVESSSQASAVAEEFQRVAFGELRLSNLGFDSETGPGWSIGASQQDCVDPFQRTITLGIDTAACKIVVPANHPAARGYLKDSLLGCACSTAGQGVRPWKENPVHFGYSRKANGH